MSKSVLPLLALLLCGCAPKVSPEAVTQMVRVGDLEVEISAPQWVTRQEFYLLKVTYTNRGQQAVTFSDTLACSYLRVRDVVTGQVPKPPGQRSFGCTTEGIPPLTLAPNASTSGFSRGIIDHFPKGRYVIAPQDVQGLRPSLKLGENQWEWPQFTPAVQEIPFEIR